eukprot:TRINITY_DN7694_c0_g1::TRINITY_DN7694_c0_g1_i1::g.18610::m.18610 TRINITY_DN7694_c0_g1::TRINITY_DN7694_c0_g1_i1::g.18610  ORF type:complete len:117 (-),score=5.78,2Fe-2S_Ferredox/PF11591.3/4.6e+03,2Fe-2S_Ferredox/PF11591.3/0.051,DUF4490/PF14892.1/0.11 TRINITY_DN7694_c0_g1_i1:404-754(-)
MSVDPGHKHWKNDKSSVKVHAPPGGQQSCNIFGSIAEEPAPRAPRRPSIPQEPEVQQPAPNARRNSNSQVTPVSDPASFYETSAASYGDNKPAVTGSRPSTRVRAPPGGSSSIVFG